MSDIKNKLNNINTTLKIIRSDLFELNRVLKIIGKHITNQHENTNSKIPNEPRVDLSSNNNAIPGL